MNSIQLKKQWYKQNKSINNYHNNINYDNYEQEIINGESILDCDLENIEREQEILFLYDEIIKKNNENLNNEIKKEIKEQKENFIKINQTINNLIEISIIEFKKEIKREKEEIEKLEKEYEEYENKMKEYEINLIGKKYEIKKEEKRNIEKWSKLKMKEIIFDSKINNWSKHKSELNQVIMNKSNLVFLIETNENIKFGGFISSKINKINTFIGDEKVFIFTFKDNKPMKYDIKKEKKSIAFCLWNTLNDYLFNIGNHDIDISKDNNLSSIFQNQTSSFDYKENEKALIGKTGWFCVEIKRILVIQMI